MKPKFTMSVKRSDGIFDIEIPEEVYYILAGGEPESDEDAVEITITETLYDERDEIITESVVMIEETYL